MSKLESDCMDILDYAAKKWPRWVPITEITEERFIPPSTIRNIFAVNKCGVFIKTDEHGTSIHMDVFDKIAKKYRYDYKIMKMKNKDGRTVWHISAVQMQYQSPHNIL